MSYFDEKNSLVNLAVEFLHKQIAGYEDYYEYNYDNDNHTPINLTLYDEDMPTIILNLHINFEDEVIVESQVVGEERIDSDVLNHFSNDEITNILKVCGII